jgi:membrane-bound ClpP family serine protease
VPSSKASPKQQIKNLANAIGRERDCDVVIFNFGLEGGFELFFLDFLRKRRRKKKNLLLFLTTEGGQADTAYRIGRYLQESYSSITIAVSGWCKSAGTLICIAAHELIVFDTGELGPLDVQIAKADELGEQSSGLAAEAAFEKLQQEAFKMFKRQLTHIKDEIAGRITFKTAADL